MNKANDCNYSIYGYEEIDKYTKSDLIVFGAGKAGKNLAGFIKERLNRCITAICDNNELLHGRYLDIPIVGINKIKEFKNCIVLICFYGNNDNKIKSAINSLVINGINNYIVIDWSFIQITYLESVNKILPAKVNSKTKNNNISEISFLSYGFDEFKEAKKGGGPIGAICMQKQFLGTDYRKVKLEYPYYSKNNEYEWDSFPFITDAVLKAYNLAYGKYEKAFIANDIFSAYGLYLADAKYSLVFHAQGDVVNEMMLWGQNLHDKMKSFIYSIEKVVVENACGVYFPSAGAEYYFRNSFPFRLNFDSKFPAYNTINDYPEVMEVVGIQREEALTFLSIGQMTELKGMDKIPEFIENLACSVNRKIRWIVVADGILKEDIFSRMEKICERFNVEYVNIDYKITHGQIFYLMSLCDVYLMLHRVSIFDFSTLEAMYNGMPIILSNIKGNDEFNKMDNILLVDEEYDLKKIIDYISNGNINGVKNKECYEKFFSPDVFKKIYYKIMDEMIG